jgi:hypothetical protein
VIDSLLSVWYLKVNLSVKIGEIVNSFNFNLLGLNFKTVLWLAQVEEQVVYLIRKTSLNLLFFPLNELIHNYSDFGR